MKLRHCLRLKVLKWCSVQCVCVGSRAAPNIAVVCAQLCWGSPWEEREIWAAQMASDGTCMASELVPAAVGKPCPLPKPGTHGSAFGRVSLGRGFTLTFHLNKGIKEGKWIFPLRLSHPDHPTTSLSPSQTFESWLWLIFLRLKMLPFSA